MQLYNFFCSLFSSFKKFNENLLELEKDLDKNRTILEKFVVEFN